MLLVRLLKALGLDIPARIEELRARVEQRVHQATDQAKHAAVDAAVTAALLGVAGMTAAAAIAIGFVALFRWVAENAGVYVGYGVVAGVLLLVTVGLGGIAWARSRPAEKIPDLTARATSDVEATRDSVESQAALFRSHASASPAPAPLRDDPSRPSAYRWMELLSVLVPLLLKSFSENKLAGRLIGTRSQGARRAGDALAGAADIVREGDRLNLAAVLAGAVVLGWLIARRMRR